MVWVYYSAQIFLFGAEFTWVYAHEYGSRRGQPRPRPEGAAAPSAPTEAKRPPHLQPQFPLGPVRVEAPPGSVGAQNLRQRHPFCTLGVAIVACMALAS